jgi:DNA-binding NtrC family response regulator
MLQERVTTPSVLVLQSESRPCRALLTAVVLAGCYPAGPYSSVAPAYGLMARRVPDCVILDTILANGCAFTLAGELRSLGVPFVFYTAWADFDRIPHAFRDEAFLEKPTQLALVSRVIRRAVDWHSKRG